MTNGSTDQTENELQKVRTSRTLHLMRSLAVLFVVGLCYYFWIRMTKLPLPCPFRLITGWKCPGCGVTTMLYQSLQLNFPCAFRANPFLFVTSPLLVLQGIYAAVLYCKDTHLPRWNERLLYIYCAALLIFGLLRNILVYVNR